MHHVLHRQEMINIHLSAKIEEQSAKIEQQSEKIKEQSTKMENLEKELKDFKLIVNPLITSCKCSCYGCSDCVNKQQRNM